jgi:hypothetical protein
VCLATNGFVVIRGFSLLDFAHNRWARPEHLPAVRKKMKTKNMCAMALGRPGRSRICDVNNCVFFPRRAGRPLHDAGLVRT